MKYRLESGVEEILDKRKSRFQNKEQEREENELIENMKRFGTPEGVAIKMARKKTLEK